VISPQRQCQLTAYRKDGELLVKCSGWLRLDNSEEVKSQVQILMGDAVEKLYLHVGELHELDSAGLGVLIGLHMTARKNKIAFQLLAPSANQMRLLETTRLTSILTILSGLEAETVRQRLEKPELNAPLPWETES
jgi:anti-anti-sigma factor